MIEPTFAAVVSALLAMIVLLNTLYLVGQKNSRDDMRQLAGKLDVWIQEFIKLKAQHDERREHCSDTKKG